MLETYVIHITKLCNLDCRYCYEKDKTTVFKWEEIKATIDKIIKYNNRFKIEFLGGEPMLASDLIIKSYEYLESFKDIVVEDYVITTNSTIISDEFLDFLESSPKISWAASIDGNEYANQLRVFKKVDYRDAQVNAYKKSIEVLMKVLNRIGNNRTSIHIVTHPYNIHLMAKSIRHFYELGIRLIGIGTIESTIPIGREYAQEFIRQINFVSKMIVNGELEGLDIDLFNYIKPRTDVKNYVYDENNKLIFESYSRADDDIIKNEKNLNIKSANGTSSLMELICDIREEAYYIHQRNLKNIYE